MWYSWKYYHFLVFNVSFIFFLYYYYLLIHPLPCIEPTCYTLREIRPKCYVHQYWTLFFEWVFRIFACSGVEVNTLVYSIYLLVIINGYVYITYNIILLYITMDGSAKILVVSTVSLNSNNCVCRTYSARDS